MKRRFTQKIMILLVATILLVCILFLHIHVQNKQIFAAVAAGDLDAVKSAINHGVDVNKFRYTLYIPSVVLKNPTLLIIACENGDEEMVKLLLSSGADINLPDKITGKTPLLAALHGTKPNRFSLALYLIANGADIEVTLKNNSPIAECLYVSKNDTECTIKEGFELFQYLISNGASIDVIPFNENALTYATRYRNYNAVDYLLKNQYFGVDDYDDNGNTALIVAAKYNRPELVKLLLEYGANVSLLNQEGQTAMDYAIRNDNDEIIEMLEKYENNT